MSKRLNVIATVYLIFNLTGKKILNFIQINSVY